MKPEIADDVKIDGGYRWDMRDRVAAVHVEMPGGRFGVITLDHRGRPRHARVENGPEGGEVTMRIFPERIPWWRRWLGW